jgi:hypothetical protein
MTLQPPRSFQIIGMRTVIVEPLSFVEDRLDDVRRQQGEPQQPVDEAAVDVFGFSELGGRPVSSFVQQPLPPMRPCQRPISVSSGRGFAGPTRRQCDDHLTAAVAVSSIGMRTVIVLPSNSQLSPESFRLALL